MKNKMKNLVEEAKKFEANAKEERAGAEYALLAVAVLNGEVTPNQAQEVMKKKQQSQVTSKLWYALGREVRNGNIIVRVKK